MVPKHLRKSDESLGGDQESLMTSFVEVQGKIKNDKSILRQPIDTGVRGVRDLMKAVVGGTEELQDLLLNECTIIYECKICKNLFRSLANFISHKRIYCIKSFTYFSEAAKQQKEFLQQSDIALESDMVNCNNDINVNESKVWLTNNRIVPNNIKSEKNNCIKPTRRIKISPIKVTRKCDIAKIADGLNQKARKECIKNSQDPDKSSFYSDIAERVVMRRMQKVSSHTENSDGNEFVELEFGQNVENGSHRDTIQLEVMDRRMPGNEAVLQENGTFRVTPQGMQLENNDKNYKCSLCETHFITQQALARHVQIHHKERICYPCPICRTFFPSPTSTYRHLSKEHHKTEQQIRRLRPKVLAKAIKRKLVDGNSKIEEERKPLRLNPTSYAEEILRCSVCGKLFNRQAVLRVHLPSCKEREAAKQQPKPPAAQPTPPPPPPAPTKPTLPPVNNTSTCAPNQRKSGILVRRDYNKKVVSDVKTVTSNRTVPSRANRSCKANSNKRVNKWRTVLKKLHSRTGLDVSGKPDDNLKSKKAEA